MAKTQKPLKIRVHNDLWDCEQVQDLIAKGHDVRTIPPEYTDCDIILSSNAWRVLPGMEKYIEVAVKAARLEKYPKKEKFV